MTVASFRRIGSVVILSIKDRQTDTAEERIEDCLPQCLRNSSVNDQSTFFLLSHCYAIRPLKYWMVDTAI